MHVSGFRQRTLLLCLSISSAFPLSALAQADHCSALLSLHLTNTEIVSAQLVAARSVATQDARQAALTGSAASAALPEHCQVVARLDSRIGAQEHPYSIGLELRLPTQWSGRFLYQGGGGMDGVVNPAIGSTPFAGSTAQSALARGYAVVSTDSGHQARGFADASFGFDQQARLDLAYAAIGRVTETALALLHSYYQKPPEHSYFMGCSNGGREAMMAAERFPTLFDGVVAGNPGFRLSHAAIAEAWDTQAFLQAAPNDAEGHPVLARAFSDADLHLVSSAILEQCDALDGAKDGLIDAMSECHFSPRSLQCRADQTSGCLTPAQVTALEKVFSGAVDSRGNRLYSTWPWDSGIDSPGWRIWKLGSSPTAQSNALNVLLGSLSVSHYFMTPARDAIRLEAVNFDEIGDQVAETGAYNDSTSTQLSSFTARKGKMIVVEGNSDPIFSADDLRQWWQRLARNNGGSQELADTARLFLVPGMTHCGGGPALDDIDPLSALEVWVEKGTAPDQLLSKGRAFPGREHPVCAYPQEAHYKGSGDVNAADSFRCVDPEHPTNESR